MLNKVTLKKWQKGVIALCVMIILMFLLVYFTSVNVSMNYADRYGYPKVDKGSLDCVDMNIDGKDYANIYGEWEFYYNRWIVTDNDSAPADGLIYLPSMWTGKEYNGKKLPKEGYASYKLTLKNMKPGNSFCVEIYVCETTYKVFANNEQILTNGTVSKGINEGRKNTEAVKVFYSTQEAGDIEIVIEISGNSLGGLTDSPSIDLDEGTNTKGFWIFVMPLMFLGVLIAMAIFTTIIALSGREKLVDMSSALFIISMIVYFLSTKDGLPIVSAFNPTAPPTPFVMNIVAGSFMNFCCILYFRSTKFIQLPRWGLTIISAVLVTSVATQIALLGTMWQAIPWAINVLLMLYIGYKLFAKDTRCTPTCVMQGLSLSVVIMLQCFMNIDYLGIIVHGMETYPVIGVIVMAISVSAIYFIIMRKKSELAIQALQLQQENSDIKQEALKAQIKPHFVFNSLSTIQHLYHVSLGDGDTALAQFGEHLRQNIDSSVKDTVPFEKELRNTLNYFNLENLRRDNKISMIFNVCYWGFEMPILSLQPLVENAVKYGWLEKKDDGYIEIYSAIEDDNIVIKVIDNGVGFDTNKHNIGGKGIKNVVERLNLVMHATVRVDSIVGEGTIVEIRIPVEGNNENTIS